MGVFLSASEAVSGAYAVPSTGGELGHIRLYGYTVFLSASEAFLGARAEPSTGDKSKRIR